MRKYTLNRLFIVLMLLVSMFGATFLPLTGEVHAQNSTLDQRLQQYIKERNIDTKAVETTLKVRCGVAQAKLKELQARVSNAKTTRDKSYKEISSNLSDLQTKLNAQAFETTDLKSVNDTYNAKVTDFSNNLNAYKQAIDDAVAVDCVANPYGFRGALETARLYHDKLTPAITDIRSYVTNTVKSSLDQIKAKLAKGDTTGSSQ